MNVGEEPFAQKVPEKYARSIQNAVDPKKVFQIKDEEELRLEFVLFLSPLITVIHISTIRINLIGNIVGRKHALTRQINARGKLNGAHHIAVGDILGKVTQKGFAIGKDTIILVICTEMPSKWYTDDSQSKFSLAC